MQKSLITKKLIAKSLKDLVQTQDFEHIDISAIMQNTGVRRQTFYNYFHDKDELLNFIFEDDFTEIIEDNLQYYDWKQEIEFLLAYFDQNKLFYKKVFGYSLHREFENFVYTKCYILMEKVISDSEKLATYRWTEAEQDFFCEYNAIAIYQLIKKRLPYAQGLSHLSQILIKNISAQIQSYQANADVAASI